jgi:hypothetical protein
MFIFNKEGRGRRGVGFKTSFSSTEKEPLIPSRGWLYRIPLPTPPSLHPQFSRL